MKKKWLIIVIFGILLNQTHSGTKKNYWEKFSKAKTLIGQNKLTEAVPVLEKLNQLEANANVAIALGDAYSKLGDPAKALNAYEEAYKSAEKDNNEVIERVALFKIARTNIWLKKHQDAVNVYQRLLAMQLPDEDRIIAKAGLEAAQQHLPFFEERGRAEIALGDAAAAEENPSQALSYYKSAYEYAEKDNNEVLKRVALFKIARTNAWLKKYQDAANIYQRLLAMQLPDEDRIIAKAGLKAAQQHLPSFKERGQAEIALGDAAAAEESPSQALSYYKSAYEYAEKDNNEVLKRVALFKIARINAWLKKYQDAATVYQRLLAMQLPDEDRIIAKAGLKAAQQHLPSIKERGQAEIALGDAAASGENPSQALSYYKSAYGYAEKDNNEVLKRVALFKIARTNIWLEKYQDAANVYQRLLAMQLADEDRAVAEAGLKTIRHLELSDRMQKARDFINKDKGNEAFELIKNDLSKEKDPQLYVLAAQSMAIMDNPQKSLEYYKQSLDFSDKDSNKIVALLGMIRMQMWLNDVSSASQTIHRLKKLPLSQREKRQLNEIKSALAKQVVQLKFERLLEQAREFIRAEDGERAYHLVKDYLGRGNYRVDMIAAESMAIMDKPDKALFFYRQAFSAAANAAEQTGALFGIAKMQFWLAWYVRAGKTYRLLLQRKLSPRNYELALAGLVKSLAYYDRPRLAYQMIPHGFSFTTPEAVIAASQAALWANWADITKNILTKYQPITSKINLNSGLGRDLQDLIWQTDLATWPHLVTPSFFVSDDAETFNKRRTTIEYTHYWSQKAQTFLSPDHISYTQNRSFKLDAKGFYIGQILRPTRYLIFKGQVEPIEYNNLTPSQRKRWNLFLWELDGSYIPNDYFSIQLLAQKEVLETFPAFNNEITNHLYSASVNLNPLPYLSFNAAVTKLNMSDTNSRDGYFLSPSILIVPDLGLTVTGVLRGFSNDFRSPNYFSPHKYREEKVVLKLGRKLGATWRYYIDGGVGRQHITADPDSLAASSPTYQWGLGINGPITKNLFISAYYAYLQQASAFIDSPDYWYQYGGVSLNVLL